MKNLITSIFLLFSLAMFGQDWQLDGTKYPNATNEGDTVSLATKVPLWDADNLQNYFADLGDILALNPSPPTPTLQSVTDEGSETTNNINVITGGGSGQRIQYSSNNIYYFDSSGLLSNLSFDTNASIGGGATRAYVQLAGGTSSLLLDHSQNASNPSASILTGSGNRGRLGIAPAINDYEAVTLGQMQDSISSHTPDLSGYVDRTTNQEVFGQKTWQDINTFNGGVTIFNGRILSDYMGLRPLTTLPSSNDTGRFGYLSSDYFAFKPIDKPTAYLDFTNLTSNNYFDFPDKSGTIALLDDIPEPIQETGDFVPTLSTFAGGTITSFTNLESYYSRLGDQVTVVVHLAQINSSGNVGNLVIGNLPFPFKTGYIRGSTGSARVHPESGVTVVSTCYNQGSEIYVLRNNDNSSTVYDMPFVNGKATITLTYITD